jgi:hypothetical protein
MPRPPSSLLPPLAAVKVSLNAEPIIFSTFFNLSEPAPPEEVPVAVDKSTVTPDTAET